MNLSPGNISDHDNASVDVTKLYERIAELEAMVSRLQTEHEQFQQFVRQRPVDEATLHSFVQHSQDGLVLVDEQGIVIEWSQGCEHIVGLKRTDVIGRSGVDVWRQVTPAEPQTTEVYRRLETEKPTRTRAEHEARDFVQTIQRPDGTLLKVSVAVFDLNNRHQCWFGYNVRDITTQARAEEAYRTLVDNSLQGLVIFQDGQIVFANAAAARITGYAIDELLAMSPDQAAAGIHPDDRQLLVDRGRERQDGKNVPQQYAFRIIHKDGSVRWLEAFSVRITYQEQPANQMTYIDITERKQAEDALQASERFIQQVAQTIPDILYIYDIVLKRNIYSNRQIGDVLGYSAEEIKAMGDHLMPILMHPDDLPHAQHYWISQAYAIDNAVMTIEYRMRHRDGSWRWLFSREVVFTRTDNGQTQQILGVAHDITLRKHAEEALRQSEARYRTLVDTFPNGVVFLFDHDMRYLVAGGQQLASIGMTPAMLEGKTLWEAVPPDIAEIGAPLYQAILQGSAPDEIEQHYGDQTYRTQPVSLRNEAGEIIAGLIISQNITEHKRIEEALRDSETNLRALINNTDGSIWAVDRDYRLIVGNNAFLANLHRVLGRTPVCGDNVLSTDFTADVQAEWRSYYDRALQGESFTIDTVSRFRQPAGHMEYHMSPIRTDDGTITGVTVFGRDITDRKCIEEALRTSAARLARAEQVAHLGSWEMELASGKSTWSDEMFRICGFSPGAFAPTMDLGLSMIHPEDQATAVDHIERAIAQRQPYDLENGSSALMARLVGSIRLVS
ncbi:MAG: PAS domain S-box protein [Chloroflexaceae bacterium]|nr:PAS domain S-box protein [Chloroflexaceae bacterium]